MSDLDAIPFHMALILADVFIGMYLLLLILDTLRLIGADTTQWHHILTVIPVRTTDGSRFWFGHVWRRYVPGQGYEYSKLTEKERNELEGPSEPW